MNFKQNFIVLSFYLVTNIIFVMMYFLTSNIYSYYYIFALGGYLITSSLVLSYVLFLKKIEIFNPLFLVSSIYSLIFFITPMLDYYFENPYYFGFNVLKGSVKGTIISILGYISFFIIYIITSYKKDKLFEEINNTKSKIIFINMILWSIGFLFSIILLRGQGISLAYIISFGTLGIVDEASGKSLNFLGMFSYSMIVPWLYLMINIKSKSIKLIFSIITLSIFYLRGFRFIILIMFIAPFVFYYTSKKKNPSIVIISVIISFLIFMIGIVGFIRGDIRSGNQAKWSEFNLESLWYGLESNFNIYKAFYRLVEIYDYQSYYTFGKQISYTLIVMIPKALWADKPDTPLREVLESTLGTYAVSAGAAWPNIGEYFSEFGVFGVILFMGFLGFLLKKMNFLYKNIHLNTHFLIIFAIGYPFIVQIIIRGYTPTNFWMAIFFFIPILINYKIGQTKEWTRRLRN